MAHRDRFDIHVGHPRIRVLLLGDFVHVADGRHPRTQVEELVNARFVHQVAHRPAEERAVHASVVATAGIRLQHLVDSLPVDGEVG